jgi:DNA-binding phage protein
MEEYEKNEDGTDKLDEQGNPIPVTKVTDVKDTEVAKVNEGLVEQIKELRLKLGVTEGLLKEKEQNSGFDPNKVLTDEEKLEALLDKKLKEKAALDAKANKIAAFEKFIRENKEFDPGNDPTGLKRDALQKKFNQFNTDGLSKVEEFLPLIREAKILLLGNDSPVDTTKGDLNPYSNPGKTYNNPPVNKSTELTPKELKLAQQTGKTREQILKLKLSNPEYLEGLLSYVRD